MRHDRYRMEPAEALALLEEAPVMRLATTTPDGEPVIRTLHGVVVDGAIAFHGAPTGEKSETVGRRAVVSADEIVAEIPSYFIDSRRACPATTYYRSVQVHGTIERVDDPVAKAKVLTALMTKFQPEGGHEPITADHPMYEKAIAGIMVLRVPLGQVDGKAKLGQNRRSEELSSVLRQLWLRGKPGDMRAIELVRRANPDVPTPDFLQGPDGTWLIPNMGAGDLEGAVDLMEAVYWNQVWDRDHLSRALVGSTVWVGAKDEVGRVIATARAIADGAKFGWVYDVVVAPDWRGRGLGKALMRLLLDHPALRSTRQIFLSTRDAEKLYEKFGFQDRATAPPRPWKSIEMVRSLAGVL